MNIRKLYRGYACTVLVWIDEIHEVLELKHQSSMRLFVIQDFERESTLIKHLKRQFYNRACGQIFVTCANEVKQACREALIVVQLLEDMSIEQ